MKQIPGFPGYSITKDGRVWSYKRNIWLSLSNDKDGYLRVNLTQNGKAYYSSVHRLVLMAYKGVCPKGMECRHLDNDRQNNDLNNLKWDTKKKNQGDRVKYGTDVIGENNPSAKLTEKDVRNIVTLYDVGLYSQRRIASEYGITQVNVGKIVRKDTWKHLWIA